MREWIRLYQADADARGEASLRKCTLHISEGEILFVLGRRNSGMRLLYEILTGQAEIRRGKLFLGEERLRERHFGNSGVLGVDEHMRLTQTLTLRENLLSLTGKQKEFPNAKKLRNMAAEIGIGAPLGAEAGKVLLRDQLLCWFLAARLRKVKLVCLYSADLPLGEEERKAILRAAKVLREEGISTVLIGEQLPAENRGIDRIAWMKEGRIVKEFYPPWEHLPMMHPGYTAESQHFLPLRRCPDHPVCLCLSGRNSGGRKEKFNLREGEIMGIYDESWPMGVTLPEYLKSCLPEGAGIIQKASYIPYDAQELLVESQSIGWNLMLAASRVTGTRLGLVQGHMERFLEKEYCRRFGLDPHVTVPELTPGQKKLLCLNRISWLHPRLILIENPLTAFEEEEKRQAVNYIRELAEAGAAIILSFRNPEEWEAFE